MPAEMDKRKSIARRVAQEMRDGYYVNLGIGLPTLIPSFLPPGMEVILQSENGMLGIGPYPFEGEEDPDSGLQLFFQRGLLWHDSQWPDRRHGAGRAAG
jgi:acyl CoA:acetate/3-ketoacid CoA transferase beta subunit